MACGAGAISTLLGTKLPGPGTIYLGQTLQFIRPVAVGDTVTVSVTVADKDPEKHRATLDCRCTNQKGEVLISGTAQVIAPTDKIKRPPARLPEVHLHESGARFRELIGRAKGLALSGWRWCIRSKATRSEEPSMPPRRA